MRVPGTRRARLIIFLSLTALAGTIGWLLYARARALYRNLGPMVVAELERQLGREVSIGRLDTSRLGRVVLDRVAVASERRLSGGQLFRARRIVIRYSWQDVLWFRTDVVGSVRTVEVRQPFLLVERDRNGRLNLQKLFKPKPAGAPPTHFRAQVVLTGGQLLFRDYKTALARLPAVNEVGAMDGVVDYRTFPRITARASGLARGGRARLIQATTFIGDGGQWLLRAYASDADAAYWAHYFLRSPAVQVRSGRANADLVVSRSNAATPVQYVVNLGVAGLGVRVARLGAPLNDAQGVAQVTPYGVKLEAAGDLGGMPVQVSGNILDWKQPQVAMSVRGSGVTLASLRRAVPQVPAVRDLSIITPGQVQAWILGPASRLYATGSLSLPLATWRGAEVRGASATWRYHAGMLQFDQITAAAARGGRLAAAGWAQLQPGPPRLYVTGQIEKLNLAGLPGISPRTTLRGEASARFAASGPLRDVHGGASVQLSNLIWNTARLRSAATRVDYQDGVVYVRSLQATDRLGRLVAAGKVGRHGALDLQVRAKGIDLAALLAPFTKQPASGTAYFVGGLDGTIRNPRLAGRLQVYAARLGPVRTDYAEGQVALRPDRVETERLVLRIYPGEIALRGTAGGWREKHPHAQLAADLLDVSVARLLAMAGMRVRAGGSLSGSLSFVGDPTRLAPPAPSGKAPSPPGWRAAGTLRVDDLLVEGARLGVGTARLETEGGRLWLRQASVEGEALAATAQGSVGLLAAQAARPRPAPPGTTASPPGWVTKESPLDVTFAVQRLDLARVSSRAGARVLLRGNAAVTDGVVRGTVGAPVVTARAQAAPLVVNGVSFDGLSGQATYTADRVTLKDVVLNEGAGSVRVTQASVLPEPGKPTHGLTADATVEAFPLERLIEVARNSASVSGKGPVTAPAATTTPQVLGTVSGSITARPEGAPAGAATLWTVALNAPKVSLPGYRIVPTTPATPVAATTPAAAAAGGTPAAQAEPLSVGLEARATYSTEGHVTVERLAVTRDEGLLLARGSVVQEGGRDAAGKEQPRGQIALTVDATEIPMGLFGPLSPELHPLSGVGELHLDAEGPLRTPRIQGSMDIVRPVVAGVPFTHFAISRLQLAAPPEGGSGKIELQNARLEIEDRDHPSGQHTLLMDGALPFRWEAAPGMAVRGRIPKDEPLSFTVRLPEQSLDVLTAMSKVDPKGVNPRVAPVLAALGGLTGVSGTMSADLTLSGTRARLNTGGSFQIANGAFQPQQGQTRFDQIAVQLGFTGNQLQVQKFQGRSSDGGRFDGSGTISGLALGVGDQAPAATMDLALSVQDLHYRERNLTGYFQERFRGTIRTVDRSRPEQPAPIRLTGDWRAPQVTGAIQVRSAHLQLPGGLPEAKTRNALFFANPALNFDLLLGKDVWLENPQMRMRMAGRLPIRGTLTSPTIRGTLVVERGQLTFPTARFRVEGSVDVAYVPAAGADAPVPLRVDLTATARLRGVDPNTGQRQRYEVTLQIRGPLTAEAYAPSTVAAVEGPANERLTIESRSDPPLSQQQILALIGRQSAVESVLRGGGSAENALRSEIEDTLISTYGAAAVFTPLETAVEDWLGLEEFSVDFALREPVQFRLTKEVYGPFYLTYTRSLNAFGSTTATPEATGTTPALNLYTVELYYRLSDRLRVGYRLEEPSDNRVFQVNTTFRF